MIVHSKYIFIHDVPYILRYDNIIFYQLHCETVTLHRTIIFATTRNVRENLSEITSTFTELDRSHCNENNTNIIISNDPLYISP